jgi:hypothetical protein
MMLAMIFISLWNAYATGGNYPSRRGERAFAELPGSDGPPANADGVMILDIV